MRIAPSSVTFTCIGVESVQAYSFLRSATDRDGATQLVRQQWVSQLADVLPLERQRLPRNRARVFDPSELGPLFEPSDPSGRVLLVVLDSGGNIQGIAGLERARSEPEFTRSDLDELGALAGALSLAATYVLAVELLAHREAATRTGSEPGSLVRLQHLFERDTGGTLRVPERSDLPLSRRESEVARLLVGGYSNLNIAAHLGISENTIRTYIRRLYKKLNVCNRIDLIRAYEAAI